MKRFITYSLASVTMLILLSCTKKEEQVIGSPEVVMPGLWRIESVDLTDYDEVTYLGSTFFNDTVLVNVGKIQIAPFSLDSLEAQDLEHHRVECTLEISSGQMNVSLNSCFRSGTDWRVAIRYNGPSGYQLIDTPVEEFYYTSHIFNNNYFLVIEDNDKVMLLTSNVVENHVITLVRV